jgi:hypothetical protein
VRLATQANLFSFKLAVVSISILGLAHEASSQVAPGVGTKPSSTAHPLKAALQKVGNLAKGSKTFQVRGTDITVTELDPFLKDASNLKLVQDLTISTTGANTYSVSSIASSLLGPNKSDFTVTTTKCPALTVQKSTPCTLIIGYNPHHIDAVAAAGGAPAVPEYDPPLTSKAELDFILTDSVTSIPTPLPSLQLTGSTDLLKLSVQDDPDLSFNQIASFYSVMNDSSNPQSITIHNNGLTPYTFSDTSRAGGQATDFVITDCAGIILDQNHPDCVITVTYSPKAAGSSRAILTVDFTKPNPAGGTPITTPVKIPLVGTASADCVGSLGYIQSQKHRFFPLDHHGVDDVAINCYYGTPANLAFITQVQYEYNPAGSANIVAADLLSFQFVGGFQLTLAGAAATSSCSAAATPTSGSTPGACSGASTNTAPSLAQDIQSIEQGGDFGLKILWPVFSWKPKWFQFLSIANPKVGFTVNGLSPQATAADATDVNANVSSENYAQWDALPSKRGLVPPASLYMDYRVGWQHISHDFAQTAMLNSRDFVLQQVTAGILINNAFRIAAERYVGPSQIFVNSSGMSNTNNFGTWQLRVQITPSALAGH